MEKEKLMILFTNKQVFHLSCLFFFYLILMSPVIFQSSPFHFFFSPV